MYICICIYIHAIFLCVIFVCVCRTSNLYVSIRLLGRCDLLCLCVVLCGFRIV